MKTLTSFFILMLGLFAMARAQNGISWTDPVKVSTRSEGTSSARIDLLQNGDPIVVYGQPSTRNINVVRFVEGVPQTPVIADDDGLTSIFFSFAGLDIATYQDSIYIVFEAGGKLYLAKSSDAGQTFNPPVLAFDPPDNKIATLSSISVDDLGNPIISTLWETASEQEARYVTVSSEDGGNTFLPYVIASAPAEGEYVCECCPSDILTDGEEVYLAFRNNPPGRRDIWVSKSTDRGQTYESSADVDETDWNISYCPISKPSLLAYSPDTMLTAFHSGASGKGRVYLNYLNRLTMESGTSFEFPLTTTFGSQNSPILAGKGDTLGLVWIENGFPGTGADLMFAHSKTGRQGLTNNFGKIMEMSGNQEFPDLTYRNGNFHLIFSDGGGLWYQKGVVDNSTSISNIDNFYSTLHILPQPVNGTCFILESEQNLLNAHISLIDLEGKLVQYWKHISGKRIDLNLRNPVRGTFILQVRNGKSITSKTIIFQ